MTTEPRTPILFLSGAGLPAWIWDEVRASLPVDSVVARIVADFEPESQRLYRDRVSAWAPPPRTGYVVTTEDKEFPAGLQGRYADELGSGWRREMATGHLPMLEDPATLRLIVKEFAAGA